MATFYPNPLPRYRKPIRFSVTAHPEPGPGQPQEAQPAAAPVESVDNHIYFYSEVNAAAISQLMRRIHEIRRDLVRVLENGAVSTPTITIHINSPGGDVFSALAAADSLMLINGLTTIIEGECASAATLIAMAASRRLIRPNAFVLIHQIEGNMWGTYQQMQDAMTMSDKLMLKLVNFYADLSNLDAAAVEKLLQRDSWIEADEAVEMGLVDRILS